MYELKVVQDAGAERVFHPGVRYDVSPVLGAQWVASGVAMDATPEASSDDLSREHAAHTAGRRTKGQA